MSTLLVLFLVVMAALSVAEAQAPVTLETLTTLRAQERGDTRAHIAGLTTDGKPYAFKDENSDQGSAVYGLQKAYGVDICGEYDVSGINVHFPFTIERNQRLVDALDSLKANSDGFAQWRLLYGHIIVTFRVPPEDGSVFIMDRVIKADFEAHTWSELLMQIEMACNAQYLDVPLLTETICLGLDQEAPLTNGSRTDPFRFRAEASLREVILAIFDKVGDPLLEYGMGGCEDALDRFHYRITVSRPGCRTDYESEDEFIASRTAGEKRRERLTTYLERINAAKKE